MQQNAVDSAARVSTPIYFPVSKLKLVVMSLCSFGLYEVYWFYQNWKLIRDQTGRKLSPFWRAVFAPVSAYWFFKSVQESASRRQIATGINPGWLAVAYFALTAAWRLPDLFWLISFLTFLPLLWVQAVVDDVNWKVAASAELNARFSWQNILIIVIGGILLILTVIAAFMPEAFIPA
ncbi:MAG: hypothetical protein ACE5G8_18390 [Anaerolineae bacterium]